MTGMRVEAKRCFFFFKGGTTGLIKTLQRAGLHISPMIPFKLLLIAVFVLLEQVRILHAAL